jgi:tetratricopeptide (TPR) repeat protein
MVRWCLLIAAVVAAGIVGRYLVVIGSRSAVTDRADQPGPVSSPQDTDVVLPSLPARQPPGPEPLPAPAPPASQAEVVRGAVDPVFEPSSPLPVAPDAVIKEAARLLERLGADFPTDPDALELAARAHVAIGNSTEAANLWKKCLKLGSGYAYAHQGLGAVAARKGDHRAAADHFRKAAALDPRSLQSQVGLGDALVNLGQSDEAIGVLEQLVKAHPDATDGFVLLGMAYLQKNNAEGSRQAFEAALGRDPHCAGALAGLADAYARLGQKDKSRECLAKLQESRAGQRQRRQADRRNYDDLGAMRQDLATTYVNAGRVYLGHQKARDAEGLWRRAAVLDPKNIDCRQALAWQHRQRGELPEAIRLLEQLAAIQPDNASYVQEIRRLEETLKAEPVKLPGLGEQQPLEGKQ